MRKQLESSKFVTPSFSIVIVNVALPPAYVKLEMW